MTQLADRVLPGGRWSTRSVLPLPRSVGSLWVLFALSVALAMLVALVTPDKALARGNGVNGYADRAAVTDAEAAHLACYTCHGSEDGVTTHPDTGAFVPRVQIMSGPSTLAPGATGTYVLRATRGTSSTVDYAGLEVTAINE